MTKEAYGPSWADCEELLVNAQARFKRPCQISVGWPVRPLKGFGKGAWCYAVGFYQPGDGALRRLGGSRTFGYGGEFKTAPAALYNAVLDAIRRMEEEGVGLETQAV